MQPGSRNAARTQRKSQVEADNPHGQQPSGDPQDGPTRTSNRKRAQNERRENIRRKTLQQAITVAALLLITSGMASAQTVIWEATLTVKELGNVKGYAPNRGQGSLSSTTFQYKGRTLTVNLLAVSELEGTSELFFGITNLFGQEPHLTNWTLTVGSSNYTDTDADPDMDRNEYTWSTYPTWSDGDMVSVKLTTTEPGAPTGVTAVDIDPAGTTVTLSWTRPTSTGSSNIIYYQYRTWVWIPIDGKRQYSAQKWTTISGGSQKRTTDVRMSFGDDTYAFEMRAANAMGGGLWSERVEVAVTDERHGLQVSDTAAYEGYADTPGGRERNIGDANMLEFEITIDPPGPAGGSEWVEVTLATRDGSATGPRTANYEDRRQAADYDSRVLQKRVPPLENDYFGAWEHITHVQFTGEETLKKVYVRVLDDLVEDSGETMYLDGYVHRTGGGLAWADRPPPVKTEGVGTIYNDEEVGQNARASVANVEAREADGGMDFTITLNERVSADTSVYYTTRDDTAVAGEDYTETKGWADFLSGETTKTIRVPILDDDVDEEEERFRFELTDFINLTGGSDGTGTIVDEDVTALTAEFLNMPSGHEGDGEDFSFRLKFNQKVRTKYRVMEDHVFEITNGEVSDARRVNRRRDLWKISIEPHGDDEVVVTLPATTDCSATGAVCSDTSQGKPSQPLSRSVTATVGGPQPDPITATFSGIPDEHDGSSEFTFDLGFNQDVKAGFRRIRDKAFNVTGGDVKKAQRKTQGSNQNWKITVEPRDSSDVTITLGETTDCEDDGAICTEQGGMLNHSTSETVLGPVGISISDAEVEEDANAVLAFAVALSRAASSQMTVDYETTDGTATAGADYAATSGTLTIDAGSSSGSIEVGVIDDEHNEGSETFTLTLSNASRGELTDASATGTITNHDALPKALIARFGRTVAVHVVEQVEERVNAPRAPGLDARVAGRQINRDMGQQFALDFLQKLGGGYGHQQGQPGAMGTTAGANDPRFGNGGMRSSLEPQNGIGGGTNPNASMQGLQPGGSYDQGMVMSLGGDRLLQGSSFALNRATSSGGVLSFWSRSAQSSFYGQDGALALNGDVRSTMFGADYAKGRMITGVSLAHTRGLGSYAGVDSGQMTSAVTGLYPWIGYKASERVTVWTVAGYGAGGLMLNPGAGAPIETGLSMAMAAGGGRGQILGGGEGFGLTFKADTLWVGMRTKAASGPGGNLDSTTAAVSRLRTALEGSQSMTIAKRMALTPSIEIGIRQDGGDAETGRGMDLGAGLVLADGVTGLAVDIRVRRLLVHQSEGFAESGMSISVSYNPTPSTPLGFTARVSPAWGGDAMSGAEALWGRESMGGMARNHLVGGGGNRLDTEVGYGLPVGARFVGTPRVGVATSEYGRDYRVGYGMQVLEQGRLNLELGIDAERRKSPVFHLQEQSGGTDQRVLGRATVQW